MVSRPRLAGLVRPARAQDLPTVRWITEEVFSVFGEYGSWLPGYLGHPGVWTYVYEENGRVDGFAMLAVLDGEDGRSDRISDLLAIAVRPTAQDGGVGRALLGRILQKARAIRKGLGLEEVRLTVADTNPRARHLFASFGFEEVEGDHGTYEKGQKALRLKLRLAEE